MARNQGKDHLMTLWNNKFDKTLSLRNKMSTLKRDKLKVSQNL